MKAEPLHVSLVAFPDAVVSTLTGIYDVMNFHGLLAGSDASIPEAAPFTIEIVGETNDPVALASGVPISVHRSIDEIDRTDIIVAPSVVVGPEGWAAGRYPALRDWLADQHKTGALLCSACSGVFLLAETGLFDGRDTTVHWGYVKPFETAYPRIPLFPEKALVVAGDREELISSGASMSWHDLVLYLIARHVGTTTAQTVARFFALQWHHDGLGPYIVFRGATDHGDAAITDAQAWLATHFSVASPVEEMIKRSEMAERTFKRRFTAATGFSPIAYVQRLRVEDAKRRLERTEAPVEEIGWRVGYEDPAFFRRLFKRTTGLTPAAYRRRFRVPDYAGG